MDANNLKIWLPFDNSPTEDLCGNSWTAYNSADISSANSFNGNALQLSGEYRTNSELGQYLAIDGGITLGGKNFTIDGWSFMDSSIGSYARLLAIFNEFRTNGNKALRLERSGNGIFLGYDGSSTSTSSNVKGTLFHFAVVYEHSKTLLTFYINGGKVGTISKEFPETQYTYCYIGRANYKASDTYYYKGTIDEFRVIDGEALWTENFTPPTAADYANLQAHLPFDFQLDFDTCRKVISNVPIDIDIGFDTSRKIANNVQVEFDTLRKLPAGNWRYENYGTADLLSVSGTTITTHDDEPLTREYSKYLTAFAQTVRTKCFDIPATDELWVKFDFFSFDSYYSWRAYNDDANGTPNGIRSDYYKIIFWSSANANKQVYIKTNVLQQRTLQTILLHMVSDSTEGIIEAWCDGEIIYTYTGNVNNGADFDNFYLQTDRAYYTFFSNVIISNQQIGFNENAAMPFDCNYDLLRRAVVPFDFTADFDTKRIIATGFDNLFDTKRRVAESIEFDSDTLRTIQRSLDLKCDTLRQIPHKVIIAPIENGLPINTPQTEGIQSISIGITAGQLIDKLTVVTVNDIDILDAVQGQILDYVYNYRVESFSKRGILSTCQCCSNLDKLLYTQIAYKVQKINWNGGAYTKKTDNDSSDDKIPSMVGNQYMTINYHDNSELEQKTVSARAHVIATANRLKLVPVMLFDDFQSTVEVNQEGVTYQDIISEVFNWSSRVPHQLINVFIRGNYLYVIQRGHEPNTFDLSTANIGKDFTIQRQLVRTSFGVTRQTADLTRKNGISNEGYWEPVLGNELPEDEQGDDDEEEQDTDSSTPARNLPSHVHTEEDGVITDIHYSYDSDGNLLSTVTTTSSDSFSSKVEVHNDYTKANNGEKLLSRETTKEYELSGNEWVLVDKKVVEHVYTTVGQQHVSSVSEDGTIGGSLTTTARHNDKPTPYDDKVNQERNDPHYYVEQDGTIFVGNGYGIYTYVNGRKVEIVGYIWHNSEYDIEHGTLEEVLLYDSSFPVDKAKARNITAALKWLNRRIQETVSLDVYDFPHIFDFRDKIIFQGNTYYLQSNNFTKNPTIVNQQSLELVRWY